MLHRLRFGWRSSLATRTVTILVLIQALLLPALYVGIDRIAWHSNVDMFDSIAQDFLTRHAETLASGRVPLDEEGLFTFMRGAIASGLVAYAEITAGGRTFRSHVQAPTPPPANDEMDVLSPGDDRIYYLSQHWQAPSATGTLRFGFDESIMHARVVGARRLLLAAMASFLALEILAGIALARYLTRPLAQLRLAARAIGDGQLATGLHASTGIREVDELARDLERMRGTLDAVATRLHQKQRLETVGTLAGGVSHEFNNVLLPIVLYLEATLDHVPEGHPARLPVERALSAAERARHIVAKLLIFSRHGVAQALRPISLAGPTTEALNLFASIRPSTIAVETDLDADADPVLIDPVQVIQVVMNLCTNAYQAIPERGGSIRVAVRNVEGPAGREVQLSVEDTGAGMDSATLSRIFEPFFTTRAVGQGSGLGLAVVHGIVTNAHGTIDVESQPGVGTTVRVRWPGARA
jgi:signal transduction histidine kinase